MSAALSLSVVGASLAGSLHCALMCGGLLTAMGLGSAPQNARAEQVTYHVARLSGYVALGVLAGSAGRALDLAGEHAGVGRAAAVVAGGLVVLWGLWALLAATQNVRLLPRIGWPYALQRALGVRLGSTATGSLGRAALLGISTSLLPCGWLYAFALSAAATGSAPDGALVMASFWLGSVPALVGVGAVVARLSSSIRRHVPLLGAGILVVVGLGAIVQRSNIPAQALEQVQAALETTDGPVKPPCH